MKDIAHRRATYAAGMLIGAVAGATIVGPMWVASADDADKNVSVTVAGPDAPADLVALPPFPTNESGMTYGSGMSIDEKNPGPELIAAVGVDGTYGFILAKDRPVNTPPPSPEEAGQVESRTHTIPLYAVDGKTVIGEFVIERGHTTLDLEVDR